MIMSNLKEKRKLIAAIFTLAGPTMLEEFLHTAVQYIDTAMVGSLGTVATAAVGSTSTVNWLVSSTVSAFGVGFLAVIARAYGAGDKKKAADAASQAVTVAFAAGAVLTAITLSLSKAVPVLMNIDPEIRDIASKYFFIIYTPMVFRAAEIIFSTVFRASGDSRTPMFAGIAVNAVNIILNFLLIYPTRTVTVFSHAVRIYGAGFGVLGAAAATAVSYAAGGIIMTVKLFEHPELSPRGRSLKPNMQYLKPVFSIAVPNMFQRFCTSFGYVAFAGIINSLGKVSTAAHTVANTVESAFYIPGYGMQSAAATLAGNALGARDGRRMREQMRVNLALEVALMTVSGTLLFIFAPQLAGIFSKDAEVIALSSRVLRMVAVSEPVYGCSIIIEGVLLGVGNTKTPFKFNVICMWGVRILGTFIFAYIMNGTLVSAWGCMICNNVMLFVLYITYYFKGKWNPLKEVS